MSLPRILEKRDMLYGVISMTPQKMIEVGKSFEAQGLFSDAVDFFSRAKSNSDLERIALAATRDGDAFLLTKIGRLAPSLNLAYETCGSRALELGKLRHAQRAFEKSENLVALSRVREMLAGQPDQVQVNEVFIPEGDEEDLASSEEQ